MKMPNTELLAPAGTLKSLKYALAYGADAVYAGLPKYSLRARNNEFFFANIKAGIDYAHSLKKLFFLTANIIPHDNKVKTFIKDITPIIQLKPDALIMADPGLMMLVREQWPEMAIHLSVQANTVNSQAVKFWQGIGVRRIILSRELSLTEIENIRQACPDIELEVFVHGSICIAYSGRCLLSGYFNRRDPNQGTCTNACRWKYKLHSDRADADAQSYYLEETTRQGQMMPIEEDDNGTYIMNSKDLRAVQHVQKLVSMGINSLKIEGRTKSFFYTARSAQVYRRAIDDAVVNKPFNPELLNALNALSNRGYTEGFYRRHMPQDLQSYESGASNYLSQCFVGEVLAVKSNILEIAVKNRFEVGDELELMLPSTSIKFRLQSMTNKHNQPMTVAPGSGYVVYINCPETFKDLPITHALLLAGLH